MGYYDCIAIFLLIQLIPPWVSGVGIAGCGGGAGKGGGTFISMQKNEGPVAPFVGWEVGQSGSQRTEGPGEW